MDKSAENNQLNIHVRLNPRFITRWELRQCLLLFHTVGFRRGAKTYLRLSDFNTLYIQSEMLTFRFPA